MILMIGKLISGLITAVGVILLCSGSCLAGMEKIADSGNITLNEGDTQAVQLQLSAPIICPGGVNPCNVIVNYVASDPSRVSISPSSVTWANTQWAQVQTIDVTAVNSGTFNNGITDTITGTAISGAVYYSGYQDIFTASINSVPAPPAPSISNHGASVVNNSSVNVNVLSDASNNPDPSTLSITSEPSHGSATDPSGVITYTPDRGFVGTDSLTYQVCSALDSAACASATLSINVTASSPDTGYGFPINPYASYIVGGTGIISVTAGLFRLRGRAKSQGH